MEVRSADADCLGFGNLPDFSVSQVPHLENQYEFSWGIEWVNLWKFPKELLAHSKPLKGLS